VIDAAGNMTWMESLDGEVDYAQDDTGQLTGADYDYQDDEAYVYDENGNRVTANGSTYETGANNQLLSDGAYRYQYDEEGNRVLKYIDVDEDEVFDSGDTDATVYSWDYRNRLTAVSHFDTFALYTSETSDQVVEYAYDFQNRLIKRVLDPDGTSGSTDVEQSVYIHEGNQIALQYEGVGGGDLGAGDLAHRYLWNPSAVDQLFADEQIHWDSGEEEFITDELLWALTDHINSVRDLATYNSGTDATTVANHRVFAAFGVLTSETDPDVDCDFGFTARYYDEAAKIQNNGTRWYDGVTSVWISQDWIGIASGDPNFYRYCGNAPLTHTDPSGTKPPSIGASEGPGSSYEVWCPCTNIGRTEWRYITVEPGQDPDEVCKAGCRGLDCGYTKGTWKYYSPTGLPGEANRLGDIDIEDCKGSSGPKMMPHANKDDNEGCEQKQH
jgi:RHS repeat-associated protein